MYFILQQQNNINGQTNFTNAAVAMQNAVWLPIWPMKLLGLHDALVTYTGISITTICN